MEGYECIICGQYIKTKIVPSNGVCPNQKCQDMYYTNPTEEIKALEFPPLPDPFDDPLKRLDILAKEFNDKISKEFKKDFHVLIFPKDMTLWEFLTKTQEH